MASDAKATRTSAKRFFSRTETSLNQALQSEAPEETIQRRFEEFRKRWYSVQEAHDSYLDSLGDIPEEDIEKEDVWLEELAARFNELEISVDSELSKRNQSIEKEQRQIKEEHELKIAKEMNESRKSEKSEAKTGSIQLERMKFSKFEGDIRKYPKFKEEFHLHIQPICSSSQLPFILKSYLSDSIKDEVDNVGNDYEAIWARLDTKYGDKGRLVDTVMADIKNLHECSDKDDEGTLKLINIVEKAHRDLIRMREEHQMNNATIISLIEQKLPEKILTDWIKEIASKNSMLRSRFTNLMELLEEWKHRIEYRLSAIRAKQPIKEGSTNHNSGQLNFRKRANTSDNNSRKQKCWIHSLDHPIWRCRTFQNKPYEERLALTLSNNACTSCLEVGHNSDNCKWGFVCVEPGCNEKHNRLLHNYDLVSGETQYSEEGSTLLPIQEI